MNATDFDRQWRYEPQTDEHTAAIYTGSGELIAHVEDQTTDETANNIARTIILLPDLFNTLRELKAGLTYNISNGQVDRLRNKIDAQIAKLKIKK